MQLATHQPKISHLGPQCFIGSSINFRNFADTVADYSSNHITNYNHYLFAYCYQSSISFSSKTIGKGEVYLFTILYNCLHFN